MVGFDLRSFARHLFGADGDILGDERLLVVLAVAAVSISGVFVVSPVVSDLRGPFGISDAAAGHFITAFTAPSIILVPVVGILADRIGRRIFIIWGLAVFGLAGAAVGLTTDYYVAIALRAVQGVGFAATLPLTVTLIGDYYSGSREATAQGMRVASIQTMSLVSPTMASLLTLVAWQFPFYFYLLAIAIAGWAWRALPEPPRVKASSFGEYVRLLGRSMRQPVLAMVLLSFVMRFTLTFGFFAHVSVLLRESIGATTILTGLLVSGFGFVALVTATQSGRLMAAMNPLLLLAGSFLLAAMSLVVLSMSTTLPLVITAVAGFGVSNGMATPIQKTLVTQLVPPTRRGGIVSMALFFQSVGQTGGPLVLGLLIARMEPGNSFALLGVAIGGAGLVLTAYAAFQRSTVGRSVVEESA